MQVDPKALIDFAVSPYVYAGNNPVAYNDPLGDQMSYKRIEWENSISEMYARNGGGGGGYLIQHAGEGYGSSGYEGYGHWTLSYAWGSGNHWADGSSYSDWDPNTGSDLFRQGLAAKEAGAPLAYHSGQWHGTGGYEVKVENGALAYYMMQVTGDISNDQLQGDGTLLSEMTAALKRVITGFEIQSAQQGGPGDPPVNSGSNDGFPWATVAGGVVGNFGLGTSITLHQITKGGTQVRLAQKGAYVGAKSFSTKLGLVGVGISLVDIGANGVNTGRALDVVMGGVAFIPVVGWGISATYFVGNLITIGVTGQSIGDRIQGAITGEDGTKSWKPW